VNKILTILTCLILTTLSSIPSILKIPGMLPFIDSEVRSAAPKAIEELRKEGVWVVNAKVNSIEKKDGKVCFEWEHEYRSRFEFKEPEIITACI